MPSPMPSREPSPGLPIAPSPVEVSEGESAPIPDNGGILNPNGEDIDLGEVKSDNKEDNMDNFMEASGCEPNANEDIHGWEELKDQIRADLEAAHK